MTTPDPPGRTEHGFSSPEQLRLLLERTEWPVATVLIGQDKQPGLALLVCPHCCALIFPTELDEADHYRFKERHIDYEVSLYTEIVRDRS